MTTAAGSPRARVGPTIHVGVTGRRDTSIGFEAAPLAPQAEPA